MIAELQEWALINNVRAFLRVIRAGESNQDDSAFRLLYGGEMFQSYNDHPRKRFPIIYQGKQNYTTAAGAFQIVETTWNEFTAKHGPLPFTPENQTLCAIWRLQYRKALDHVIYGRLDAAIRALTLEWTSLALPKRQAEAAAIYLKYGGTLSTTIAIPSEPKPMAPILLSLLPSLIDLLPKLGSIFGSGSEVSNRNIAAATVVADAVKAATNSPNLQAAIEAMQDNPALREAANAAVDAVWASITEVGSGGIKGARDANLAMQTAEKPFWYSPAFWITLLLLAFPGSLCVDVFYVHPHEYDANARIQVVTALLALLTIVGGYWLGSSAGSAKKDDALKRLP